MNSVLTLALDTSTSQGGVAVLKGEQVLSRAVWVREKSHSELLTPTIEECLREAGADVHDLKRIAVGRGPGSFTGIRIAINAAKSLGFALKLPIFAFDTAEILSASVSRVDLPVLTLINAHKNLLYTSIFRFDPASNIWIRNFALQALSPEEIANKITTPHICLGDGYEEYASVFRPDLKSVLVRDPGLSDYPQPEVLGRLSWRLRDSVSPLDWNELQALYIRASGAEENLREKAR